VTIRTRRRPAPAGRPSQSLTDADVAGEHPHVIHPHRRPSPHPCPGARPGETIAVGPTYRWMAYAATDEMVAACYVDGRLLRRDVAGWWCAGWPGERLPMADGAVAPLVGSPPDGWPVLAEQAPLLGADALTGAS